MNMFPAALMLVLLLAPSGFALECYECDGVDCNEKFDSKKTTCAVPDTTTPVPATTVTVSTTPLVTITTTKVPEVTTTPVPPTTPKPDEGIEGERNPNPILVKKTQYSYFGRQLKAEDDLFRCVKVIHKVGDERQTKRGCYKVGSDKDENDPVCMAFVGKQSIEECGVCGGDLCNSAKISQMSKALALVFLLPLLRFFY